MGQFRFYTPLGAFRMVTDSVGCLKKIDYLKGSKSGQHASGKVPDHLFGLLDQLTDYLQTGNPIENVFWDHINQEEWTAFQTEVYRMIATIPHGETRSYKWVAQRLKNQSACRAVGQALRKNPLPILIPCHRVVSSHGGLGGFMGKVEEGIELSIKKRLLDLEETYLNPKFSFIENLEPPLNQSLLC